MKNGSIVTIGVFDGVHIGHKKIITDVVRRAHAMKLKSVAVTFDPHPFKVLNPRYKIPSLVSLKHRLRLIKELGIDTVAVLNFTKFVARLAPECFVKNILINKLGAKEIIVGENFYFGKGARSGAGALKRIGEDLGLKVRIVKSVKKDGKVVSSSAIRRLITGGKLSAASELLGRSVSVLGTVVGGSRFARVLGYPTANINPHHEVIPPFGVYAVKVRFSNRLYRGMLNIGTQPTFFSSRDKEPKIEAHIFGFNKRIYGRDIEVLFVKKLRNEKKFTGETGLIRQIRKDEKAAKQIV